MNISNWSFFQLFLIAEAGPQAIMENLHGVAMLIASFYEVLCIEGFHALH